MINLYGDQTGAMQEQFSAEYELLADCARLPRHPNIICVLHSFNDLAAGRLPGWDFDPRDVSPRTTLVVMPLCDGGDLKNLINRHCSAGTRVQEPVLRSLLRQLCLAVAHLKAHRISHRDIKPDNVMLRQAPLVAGGEQEQQVVLIDFGQCMDFGLTRGVGFRFPLQFPLPRGGAPGFLAPEIATPKPGRGVVLDYAKNDDWAVGMLLHALLSAPVQAQPFSCGEDPRSFRDDLFLPVDMAAGLGLEWVEMSQQLLRVDPAHRMEVETALEKLDPSALDLQVKLPGGSGRAGSVVTVRVDADTRVATLKRILAEQSTGWPGGQLRTADMRLIYAGRELSDELSFRQHSLAQETSAQLLLRLRQPEPEPVKSVEAVASAPLAEAVASAPPLAAMKRRPETSLAASLLPPGAVAEPRRHGSGHHHHHHRHVSEHNVERYRKAQRRKRMVLWVILCLIFVVLVLAFGRMWGRCHSQAHHPQTCNNHGTCATAFFWHTCSCSHGWSGSACDQPTGCDGDPCGEHGSSCVADGGEHTCTCTNAWHGTDCGVDCSSGDCPAFTLSGAWNTDKYLPSGTDLNGWYPKTAHACHGKPVYQKGGGGGDSVLYLGGNSLWRVAPSSAATDCGSVGGFYLESRWSSCSSSPDDAGCVGEWREYDSSGNNMQPNPGFRVVASDGHSPPPPPPPPPPKPTPRPPPPPSGCDGSPCAHGGKCIVNGAAHTCACERGWHGVNCTVDCSVKGNCFNISGAKNTDPSIPKGTDLNGQYIKTAHTCNGKGAYQQGGSGGPVLFYDSLYWDVGPSSAATNCSGNQRFYLYSGVSGSCPASPDGAGCAGKWAEHCYGYTVVHQHCGGYRTNPAIKVVASGAESHS